MSLPVTAAAAAKASLTAPPEKPESMRQRATLTDRPAPRALVRVWLTGIAAWGHRWASALGDSPLDDSGSATLAGALWAQELAGFTEAQILGALESFVRQGHDWPPSLPMVRVQCAGIPSLNAVLLELRDRNTERTGFTRLVWSYLDAYRLKTVDADKHDRMIRDAYDLARENVLMGRDVIPEEAPAIAAPVAEPAAPVDQEAAKKVALEAIAEVNRMLGIPDRKSAASGRDL